MANKYSQFTLKPYVSQYVDTGKLEATKLLRHRWDANKLEHDKLQRAAATIKVLDGDLNIRENAVGQIREDFQGVVVIIGGNPCMHPKFDEITKIFAELRPNKQKRGLWTNNFFKHEKISTELYGVFNLNTHGDSRSTKSLKIPKCGSLMIIANHPFGIIDGLILCSLVSKQRSDFKIMTHETLKFFPELDEFILPVDFTTRKKDSIKNKLIYIVS